MNNTNKYILYYAAFCVSIDVLDRSTNIFQKQTGFFGKAYNFPYTDGWSLFHIAWGIFGFINECSIQDLYSISDC